jgi:hypothetical protein
MEPFFAIPINCLQEGSSAGKYEIVNDTLKLKSSIKIFNKLKRNSGIKKVAFVFVELHDLKFIINESALLSIK